MDLKSKFQIQNVTAYILQILQYLIFYICLDHFHIFWVFILPSFFYFARHETLSKSLNVWFDLKSELPNISRSKGNLIMKHGHLIEYKKRNIVLQKLYRKWGRKTSSRPAFIFQKSLIIWGNSKFSATLFQYISIALNWRTIKTNCRKL